MARYRSGWRGYGYGGGYGYGRWAPYVPVSERRRQATAEMNALRKKGVDVQPIVITGRKIASSFWGEAWCDHLESFSDFENRLPRGRTYVRNGSVCHLAVEKGKIEAKVSGSRLYTVQVSVKTLPAAKWVAIKKRSRGQIGTLLELLQGKLSDHVMQVVTDQQSGLFPAPKEISFQCDCPDWAYMCKHVAAVLYGVGARLDTQPELLFTLRDVDHEELITADTMDAVTAATSGGKAQRLAAHEIGDVFGIELQEPETDSAATDPAQATDSPRKKTSTRTPRVKKSPAKKTPGKKSSVKKSPAKKSPVKKTPLKKKPVKKKPVKKKKAVKQAPTAKTQLKKKRAKKPLVKKTRVKAASSRGAAAGPRAKKQAAKM